MSYVTPLVVMSTLILSLDSHSFHQNSIKVTLDLSNSDQLIPIASEAMQNITFVELLLSTRSLCMVS